MGMALNFLIKQILFNLIYYSLCLSVSLSPSLSLFTEMQRFRL